MSMSTTGSTEPKDSEGSSRDEHQHCPHYESEEHPDRCCVCGADDPAEGETAGRTECRCTPQDDGVNNECVQHPLHVGPEAPECSACGSREPDGSCPFCAHRVPEPKASLPPRPPIALTYVTGSGERIEIALPGDATVGVHEGALIVCHPSGVLGIQQVKPYEESA